MVIFRCTRKLLERLPSSTPHSVGQSTTALGDWYVTAVFAGRERLLLFVSEHPRLPIVLPAKGLGTMTVRFRETLARVLSQLDVSELAVGQELVAMVDVA